MADASFKTGIVSPKEISPYGEPKADESFFQSNPFKELSGQRLIYSCLLNPHLEPLANRMVKQVISRGEEEERMIMDTDDPVGLIAILKQELDPLNQGLLIDKILEKCETIVPLLIEELRHDQNDCFAELTIRILYNSKMNCSLALLRLIHSMPLDAYALSLICLVLGMTGGPEALQPLWDRFHFFKARFPCENFSQGPLLGLYELRDKMPLSCEGKR